MTPAGPAGRLTVVRSGPLTTVQDLGRPGWAHLGVPRCGALDAPALRRANRLVGNPDGAAALETTLLGCALRCDVPTVVAVTGAPAGITVDGAPVAFDAPVTVAAGATLDVGRPSAGVRSYVAVAGGIAVTPVLGSRSTDTLCGLGPARLAIGDTLPLGRPVGQVNTGGGVPMATLRPGEIALPVWLGPRADWFASVQMLFAATWLVTTTSNRVGTRLAGPALTRAIDGELPSEGIVLGAIQVPPDGQPLIFLADHPTTGGYPVIGVVADVTPLAQARPGATVTFHGPER